MGIGGRGGWWDVFCDVAWVSGDEECVWRVGGECWGGLEEGWV